MSNLNPTVQAALSSVKNSNFYPQLRDDKRNFFNSAIEGFVKSTNVSKTDNGLTNQIIGAARDLGENYINMVNANYKSTPEMQNQGTTIDNYYHCIGNYDVANRGALGGCDSRFNRVAKRDG